MEPDIRLAAYHPSHDPGGGGLIRVRGWCWSAFTLSLYSNANHGIFGQWREGGQA